MRAPRWTVLATMVGVLLLLVVSGSGAASPPAGRAAVHAELGVTRSTSTNWAGYFAAGSTGSVTSVVGRWVEPQVTCTGQARFVALWVGIDGANSNTVEQTGTMASCVLGVATYSAWWELYPLDYAQTISTMTIRPGDTINASVVYSSGDFTMSIADGAQSFAATGTQTAALTSAECVAERPVLAIGGTLALAHLADFGTATFSNCTATIGGNTAGIGAFASVGEVTMVSTNPGAAKIATVSKLAPGKDAFSITWKRAY